MTNPYAIPATEATATASDAEHHSTAVQVLSRNPARFILIPVGLFCVVAGIIAGGQVLDPPAGKVFLVAAVTCLVVLFGLWALLAGCIRYGRSTQIATILWSAAATFGLLTTFVEDPPYGSFDWAMFLLLASLVIGSGLIVVVYPPSRKQRKQIDSRLNEGLR